nr:MAG TPA: hypothetical protein [Caudoviricetes sp.]
MEVASFFALCAGRYLNHARPVDEAPLSVTRLLAESCLKTAQKPYAVKRTRTALESILMLGNQTILFRCAKRARKHDRRK